MESIEKLRDLAADINGNEIIDHMQLYPSCVFDDSWLDAWHRAFDEELEALKREIAEKYMPLPVDADGVPIHVGDEVVYDHKGLRLGKSETVKWIAIGESETHITTEHNSYSSPDVLRHVKPRTLRDVLFDFMRDCETSELGNSELVEKYEVELRELLGGEE